MKKKQAIVTLLQANARADISCLDGECALARLGILYVSSLGWRLPKFCMNPSARERYTRRHDFHESRLLKLRRFASIGRGFDIVAAGTDRYGYRKQADCASQGVSGICLDSCSIRSTAVQIHEARRENIIIDTVPREGAIPPSYRLNCNQTKH